MPGAGRHGFDNGVVPSPFLGLITPSIARTN